MPKKSFFENELNSAWHEAREKGIEYGIALGHKEGTQGNDRKGMLYVACEMQDIGCMDPSDIDVSVFNRWREYTMSDGNRRGKAISDTSFKKRKEALIVLLKALDLVGPLKVVQQHRSDIRAKEIQYWSREELEAMTRRAMEVFRNEPKRRSRAIAHIIHVIAPPRREDTASIRWDYFDLKRRRLLFPAKKNGQQPGNVIQERFIPILSAWKEITSEDEGGDVYLFPSSRAQKSGSTKKRMPHISGKTIVQYLTYIRETTSISDNNTPQSLSSQKYRHTFAMHALESGCTLEFVAKVLGDSIQTVERYYSRFLLNNAHEREFDKMYGGNARVDSEGSSQPAWLSRHERELPDANAMAIAEGFRLHERNKASVYGTGGSNAESYGGRWGI